MLNKKLKIPSASDWTPVLKGDVFCSPACGAECKKADFDRCVILANKLVKTLTKSTSLEWKPLVNENLRWFYGAQTADGKLRIGPNSYDKPTGYTAFMGAVSATGSTPKRAVLAILVKISDRQQFYMNLLRGFGHLLT